MTAPFKHAHLMLATDFELEPVIDQYLTTYPNAQPRNYEVAVKLRNERREGDYCYILVYEHVPGNHSPNLYDFIKAYCELNDKVARIERKSGLFPDIPEANYGNAAKYRKG